MTRVVVRNRSEGIQGTQGNTLDPVGKKSRYISSILQTLTDKTGIGDLKGKDAGGAKAHNGIGLEFAKCQVILPCHRGRLFFEPEPPQRRAAADLSFWEDDFVSEMYEDIDERESQMGKKKVGATSCKYSDTSDPLLRLIDLQIVPEGMSRHGDAEWYALLKKIGQCHRLKEPCNPVAKGRTLENNAGNLSEEPPLVIRVPQNSPAVVYRLCYLNTRRTELFACPAKDAAEYPVHEKRRRTDLAGKESSEKRQSPAGAHRLRQTLFIGWTVCLAGSASDALGKFR
jgi:hypothetical protein